VVDERTPCGRLESRATNGRARCWWCSGDDAYLAYHDEEWGRPVRDDRRLFEKICLEGFQAA
jgi:DNA-3-methyladenine glycosylase I